MKKLLFTAAGVAFFTALSFAQIAPSPVGDKPELSKEEKKAMKEKKAAEQLEAFKAAGLTEDEIAKANEIMAEAGEKGKDLKANDKLTAEEKDVAKKAINDDKNAKLKALMGDEKYKLYNAAKKKQKEAMQADKSPQ